MFNYKRILGLTILIMVLLNSTSLVVEFVNATRHTFKLLTYNYKSSAGTSQIYPGSKNVQIVVEVQYVGNESITGVTGRIQLPPCLTISRGSQASSPAYTPNGTTYTTVKPGDIVLFKYKVDVLEEAKPGTYKFSINITYRLVGNPAIIRSEVISNMTITISAYPKLKLNIIDTYWSPDAYPGSEGVSLNIIVENNGNSMIVSGNVLVELPKIIEPREVKLNLGTLNKKDRVTLTLSNLDISVDAKSNYRYQGTMYVTATARTDDGVTYRASAVVPFTFTISDAPIVRLEVIDYGLTAPHSVSGLRYSKVYVTFQNKDTATINAITAMFSIVNNSLSFINGSRVAVTTIQGMYGYGDYITIESSRLIIRENFTGIMCVKLVLTIFGSKDGAEFWSTQEYLLTINITKPVIDVGVVKVYWSSQRVYPGSDGQSLNIVVENLDTVDFIGVVATLKLPSIFTPNVLTVSGININSGFRTTITFRNIDISRNAKPGVYTAILELNGLARSNDNSFYRVSIKLPILVNISSPNISLFEVVDYGWSEGRAYTTSCNVNAYISLRVASPVTTRSILLKAILPPQLTFMNNRRTMNITVSGSYGYGQVFRVEIGPINVTVGKPGITPIVIAVEALVKVHDSSTWIYENLILPLRVDEPKLNLTIIDSGWYEGYASTESYGVTAYVTLQSLHIDRIKTLLIIMKPNIEGVIFESGKNEFVWVGQRAINYGDIITATFSGIDINVNTSQIPITLKVECVITLGRSYYRVFKTFRLDLKLVSDDRNFIIVEASTLHRGRYAPLLPTAHDITLRLILINIKPTVISSVNVKATLPEGFKLKGIGGSCLNGVTGGSTCTLELHMDVGNVSAGVYQAEIVLECFRKLGNSIVKLTQVIHLNLVVEPVETWLPLITMVTWYWGRGEPITVFEHERNVPLTLILMNIGRYTAEGVRVLVESLNSTVRFITNSSYCTLRLNPGESCRATLYLDLANVSVGNVYFKVYVIYLFREYGTHIMRQQVFLISLPVERFAGGKGLEIVSSNWENEWPVYPNTENATFTITLANRWPYRISGLKLELHLPSGFTSRSGRVALAYISGPVESLATVTADFKVTVGNVTPGRYIAKLIADYVVICGGAQIKVRDEFNVTLIVHSIKGAIQLVCSTWYGESPEPGTYGALLLVLLRNNYVAEIKGPILELYLPYGFTCSINNSTYATVPPYTQMYMQLPVSTDNMISQETLIQLPRYIIGDRGELSNYRISEGQMIVFIIPLNVLVERTGTYYAKAYLNFLDHWGNVRRLEFTIPIIVFGSTKLVEVYPPVSVKVVNGTIVLPVTLVNKGWAPVYDIYILIAPQAPIAIPVQNVKYINVMKPNSNITILFYLTYNPTSILGGMGSFKLRYTSLPLLLTIRYKDVLGYPHIFNTSVAVLIEPFIDIRLGRDVKAELRGSTLVVSGTIVNYGLSTARSVEVKVIVETISSATFIGDIDPASQSAFRVEVPVDKSISRVVIQIVYQDDYGRVHEKQATLPVKIVYFTTPTRMEVTTPLEHSYIIVTVMVAVFLALVAILLHRFLKKHSKLQEELKI